MKLTKATINPDQLSNRIWLLSLIKDDVIVAEEIILKIYLPSCQQSILVHKDRPNLDFRP